MSDQTHTTRARYKTHLKPRIIDEEAMPAGLFPGTSKSTFDALFFEASRRGHAGARFQITRRELLRLTGVKSVKTLGSHLRHFCRLRVLTVTPGPSGSHLGNFYQIHCDRFPEAIEKCGRRPRRLKLSSRG